LHIGQDQIRLSNVAEIVGAANTLPTVAPTAAA
jgi:hypothetical protein